MNPHRMLKTAVHKLLEGAEDLLLDYLEQGGADPDGVLRAVLRKIESPRQWLAQDLGLVPEDEPIDD